MNGFAVVLTTVGSVKEAQRIADALLEKKLAACVQQIAIQSSYLWKGAARNDEETLLLIKGRSESYEAIQQLILSLNSYELPEIIQIPITDGHPTYLRWLDEETH